MTEKEATDLLIRYKKNQCTDAEKALAGEWLSQYSEPEFRISDKVVENIGNDIFGHLPQPGKKNDPHHYLWPLLSMVGLLLILTCVIFFYFNPSKTSTSSAGIHDISPGGNKAILTLSGGKTINLSEGKTGIVISSEKLSYNDGTAITSTARNKTDLQILSTPKGGQYQITLSDGTNVFLNADSKLSFPSAFAKDAQRKVILKGEAYFQVAKDKTRPFVVTTGQQDVLVLGTYFNVNAYETLLVKTTLVEGSVKVTSNAIHSKGTVVIKPGQQALLSETGLSIHQADLGLEMAWRNGKTEFRDADLKTIMGMLERWYNIETIYPNHIPNAKFSGSVSRTRNISELLDLLTSTGEVRFKIEGRRVRIL